MSFLLLSRVADTVLEELATDTLHYRHDLLRKGPRHLSRFLRNTPVSVIVTSDDLDPDVLTEWARAANRPVYLACYGEAAGRAQLLSRATEANVQVVAPAATVTEAFQRAEQRLCLDRFGNLGHTALRKHITFVGAGVVNLIVAHFALREGHSVSFIDARPDPRRGAHWRRLGCSAGGGNARMFTLSEMDNYNCRSIHDDMNWQFSRSVRENGWNVIPSTELNADERHWIDSFENIPSWLADSYNEAIFRFNRESHPMWDRWISEEPELFAESGLQPDILRVYSNQRHFETSRARQERVGAKLRDVSIDHLAEEQPILQPAIAAGQIIGGVYVHGFTVNVHRFMMNLIDRFEQAGAEFRWDTEMTRIITSGEARIDGIELSTGERIGGNIVIAPGVYAGAALNGTGTQRQICAVLGAWLSLPDPEGGLRNSLKLARLGHITEDANVTVGWNEQGERCAIIGSGYGFTGFNPDNIDPDLLEAIYDGLKDTAATCFPEQFAAMMDAGTLNDTLKYCVRPWTPSGLGLFESFKSQESCVVIIGGHNTGGFAQAPAIGAAVVAAMRNERHQMHADYHADRLKLMARPMPELV